MSTRATYHFESENVTFYIHSDGYQEGAAVYFWNMLHCENQRGGFAAAFIRANERAEFTPGHNAHGDTEYQYTLSRGNILTVKKVGQGPAAFVGPLAEFINQFGAKYCKNFEDVHLVKIYDGWGEAQKVMRTVSQLIKELGKAKGERDEYVKKFPTHSGNIAGHVATVKKYEEILMDIHAKVFA